MNIVYHGGRQEHMDSDELYAYVHQLDHNNARAFHPDQVLDISDAAAQTIASWWHSPGEPNSTRLSTMGQVMADTGIEDFATEAEYINASPDDKLALKYLDSYIRSKKNL